MGGFEWTFCFVIPAVDLLKAVLVVVIIAALFGGEVEFGDADAQVDAAAERGTIVGAVADMEIGIQT